MNQILSTTNASNGKKNRGPAEISTVVKFFVISLIIFGIFMIGTGSYAIYNCNTKCKLLQLYVIFNIFLIKL